MPPQMYFVLDSHPKLKQILENQRINEKLFFHKHDCIYYDNLAKSVNELEKTEEFKKLHTKHTNNNDFNNIIF